MSFGKEGVIAAVVGFLRGSRDPDVHRATARALHELSRNPDNCITMHRAGAIRVTSYCRHFGVNPSLLASSFNPLTGTGNCCATLNNMKLVHGPLMGGLLHLVQRGRDAAHQAPPHCAKCNSPPIDGQAYQSPYCWMVGRCRVVMSVLKGYCRIL